jgi:hypothetical protein
MDNMLLLNDYLINTSSKLDKITKDRSKMSVLLYIKLFDITR